MSQKSVLIVDDEEICLAINAEMVKRFGMPVIIARDGLEAVEIFERKAAEISCILLDLQMPRMNGLEALRRIRQLDETIPVAISSGYLTSAYLELLEPLNPIGYLNKPLSYKDLDAFLQAISKDC